MFRPSKTGTGGEPELSPPPVLFIYRIRSALRPAGSVHVARLRFVPAKTGAVHQSTVITSRCETWANTRVVSESPLSSPVCR